MGAIALISHSFVSAQALYEPIAAISTLGIPRDNDGGHILDFSRVGYQYGDKDIPDVRVVKVIKAPKKGADATALIQSAVDEISALPFDQRGAILLKAGQYNVSGSIRIRESGIVIRGEGTHPKKGTRIHSTRTDNGAKSNSTLFLFSGGGSRGVITASKTEIIEDAPVGQFWVRVTNADKFYAGDEVVVHAETPMTLISDLQMDRIPERKGYDVNKYRWNERTINRKDMERVVTKVSGDTLWFENPISMSLLKRYNRGYVANYRYTNRISESGIEDIYMDCVYSSDTDENHCWSAVVFQVAEHCWARRLEGKYFGMSLTMMTNYAKNITISDCKMSEHKSIVTGNRRYPFLIAGQLCLVKDCYSKDARHAFATSGARTNGPNVFLRCHAIGTHTDTGPHHRWATGTLYDNVVVTGKINVQDRSSMGPGHGWAGVNEVLWNCEADAVAVQSPWVCGANYSIGTIGRNWIGFRKERPQGVWISHGKHVAPQSLYESQLAHRRKLQPGGVFDIK